MSADRRIVYAAFLPFLLLALPILPSDSPSGGGGGGQTLAPPAAKYVVRFVEYRAAEDHREYLEAGLRGAAPPAGSWRWVERRNPAVAFPTDFAVLEIRDVHHTAVVAAVRALGRVRDVHADTSYSRGVLSVDRPQRRGSCLPPCRSIGRRREAEILRVILLLVVGSGSFSRRDHM